MYTFGIVLLLLSFGISSNCVQFGNTKNVTEYLQRRLKETKINIAKSYFEENAESVVTLSYDENWERLWSEKLKTKGALTVRMFNKMFILEGNRVMSVAVEPASTKTSSSLREVGVIHQERPIRFVKSTVWNSNLYLLVCHYDTDSILEKSPCSLYTGKNDLKLTHTQMIGHKGRPMDADFFTMERRLYLVVANNLDPHPVSSIIYRWTGTYMDIDDEISAVGAVAVTAFNYKTRVIIVLGLNEKAQPDVVSEIYEYKSSGKNMIQYLPTKRPTSMHHYYHNGAIFLLTINELAPTDIYWWDGNYFVHWLDLPDIIAPKMVHVAHLSNDTLFVVSYEDSVSLYKVTGNKCSRVNLLQLKNDDRVVDMGVWIDERTTLTLLLVTVDVTGNLYRIEPWELRIKKIHKNAEISETDGAIEECFSKLYDRLMVRMKPIENVVLHTWPMLISSTKNVNSNSLIGNSKIEKLILHSTGIAKLSVPTSEEILLASEIETLADSAESPGSRIIVNSILDESRKTVRINEDNHLVGNVIIQQNATFEQLHIDSLRTEYLNGEPVELENSVISATRNQTFYNTTLQGDNITVQYLEIDQLCGMSADYWLKDTKLNNIFTEKNEIEIMNNSVLVRTDLLTFPHLQLNTLQSIQLNSFLSDLFIIGERQVIKGNIFKKSSGTLSIDNLIVDELNDISERDLIAKAKNQRFENDVFVRTMSIENLFVEKVNGIAISESAMVSKKNHITGQVTVAVLRVLDEFVMDNATTYPKVRPVQIYDEVTLTGKIKVSNLTLERDTYFALSAKNNSTIAERTSIASATKSHWTKSTSQVIKNPVIFDAGISIDELKLNYLNSFNIDEDFMFTNMKDISQESGSLEFQNFIVAGSIFKDRSDETNENRSISLYEESDDTIYFNEEFRIERLGVEELMIENFNGIPFEEIIKRLIGDSEPYEYSNSVQRFDSVTVNDRFETEYLDLGFVNEHELPLDDLLQFDASYTIKYLKSEELTIGGDVRFAGVINGKYIKKLINSSVSDDEEFQLTIDGELIVEGNLEVNEINDKSTESYLDELATRDLVVNSSEQLIIDNLTVRHDLELNFLQNLRFDSLWESTFSKSREQNLGYSRISFFKVCVNNLQTDWINGTYIANLIHTDSYDITLGDNVTFTNLNISFDEDVQTKYLNNYQITEIYEKLSNISPRVINDLTVRGNIFWQSQSPPKMYETQFGPLESIVRKGVMQGSETSPIQEINGPIRIDTGEGPGVFVHRMNYEPDFSNLNDSLPASFGRKVQQINGINLEQIVQQSVLDDISIENEIKIVSKTSFMNDLTTDRLNVAGEIGIGTLNTWRVKDLSSSIVEKNSLSSLTDKNGTLRSSNNRPLRQEDQTRITTMFGKDVKIRKLIIQTDGLESGGPRIHGVPIGAIFHNSIDAPNKKLPNNTYFEQLQIDNNAFIKSLDSIDFDDFVKDRVTLGKDHEVYGNIQFNGRIQVSESAAVNTINGINPSDLVINNSDQDQIITGEKIFHGDIITYGKIYAPIICGVNVTDQYNNAVRNYKTVDIFSDIIFETDVQRSSEETIPARWRLSSESYVNGMQLKSLMKDRESDESRFLQAIMRNESLLEDRVARAANATRFLPELFFYLESEENLTINVAQVERVEVLRIEELTILNMYANQLGRYCGLPDDCPCRKQYVAEISANDCQIRQINGQRVVYNFHPTDGAFAISVTTGSVSSSKKCTHPEKLSEPITISWMKNVFGASTGTILGANVTEAELEIHGYLSDVQVFTQNGLVFIALAIYYDPSNQSHQTNSFIYMLDLATDVMTLVQEIPTSHAIEVQVFKISNKGVHVLFSSFGSNEPGKSAQSLLYRFKPNTAEFELLRSFSTGGNRHAKSVTQSKDEFLLLDDFVTNSINVYIYDKKSENFHYHQSLYLNTTAPITAIEAFYSGEFRHSQVYVIVTTELDQFFLYEYMFMGGFQLIAQKRIDGILAMVPFDVSSRRYIFVGTDAKSLVLRIVQQGPH